MIDIAIDQLVPQAILNLGDRHTIEGILTNLATAAQAKWRALARQRLDGHTREAYLNGIQPIEVEVNARVITLVGWLPNAVEQGQEAYDMRDTLLGPKSRLRRVAASGGLYGNVPFRHQGPGTEGLHGSPMGRQYGPTGPESRGAGNRMSEESAKSLGQTIYKHAKRLKGSITPEPNAKTKWGQRLPRGLAPRLVDKPLRRPTGINKHKTDLFAGMVRVRHTYEKKTDTQYMTFRTISTKVTTGWHHPGIEARHLAEDVRDYIEEIAPAVIRAAIRGALGGR
ncbi:MAG: hypothetical protein ACYTFZ_08695 [Planctomycetota bacterium]|jgi:hypothetical protein